LVRGYPRHNESFIDNPGAFLLRKCDLRAKQIRLQARKNDQPYNIKHMGEYAITV